MTKYLIYCRIHIMGSKCCVRNCKSGYKRQVKITETSFHKFREEWKNKIHWGGKWPMTEESFLCSKHFEWRYLDILKLKCCCLGLTMYTWPQWTQILCVLCCWFCFQSVKKSVTYAAYGNIFEENFTLEINIEGIIPENRQFLVDELIEGVLLSLVFLHICNMPTCLG